MSVFVDTGVFVAHQNVRDRAHLAAAGAMAALAGGRHGAVFTSDYVLDETLMLTRRRTKSLAQAVTVADRILGRGGVPRVFELLLVTGPVLRDALRIFETYTDRELSFTDATTIALVQQRRIGHVLSFDADFDGIVPRIVPEETG